MALVALSLSFLLTLLVVEGALRLFHPVELHATDTYLGAGGTMQAGSMVLVPGATAHTRTDEFDIQVRINSRGLRDREIPYEKPAGVYRILVLGDSQTFGQGVEAEETYSKALERRLAKATGRRIETINTGVPGTGTAHQLHYLETEGWKYQPDMVLLGFFYNDLMDNGQCRLYGLRNGKLIHTARASTTATPFRDFVPVVPKNDFRAIHQAEAIPQPQPPFLIRHSHLARFVREQVSRIKYRTDAPKEVTRPSREMTKHLVQEIARQCREKKVPFALLLIPGLQQHGEKKITSGLFDYWKPLLEPAVGTPDEVIDPWKEFEAAGFQRLFFPVDTHLTAEAHDLIAEIMVPRLIALDRRLSGGGK